MSLQRDNYDLYLILSALVAKNGGRVELSTADLIAAPLYDLTCHELADQDLIILETR